MWYLKKINKNINKIEIMKTTEMTYMYCEYYENSMTG